MADTTTNLGLTLAHKGDIIGTHFINENFNKIDNAFAGGGIGGGQVNVCLYSSKTSVYGAQTSTGTTSKTIVWD